MSYVLATLWFDRQRYLPGVAAVAFSNVLITLQAGLLLGLLSVVSTPIDCSRADIWVGEANILSVDVAQPISESKITARLVNQPGITQVEPYILHYCTWEKPDGGADLCIVVGSRLDDDSLGTVNALTAELRTKLGEDGTVVVDEAEIERLDIADAAERLAAGVAVRARVGGLPVRVVGVVSGMKGIAGPYIFCSLRTARSLLRLYDDQTIYVLARCDDPLLTRQVLQCLRDEHGRDRGDMDAVSARELSVRSRIHWLTKTGAGVALGYAAFLGLLVGALVTTQTLYSATVAARCEWATLISLGIPRRRLVGVVLAQACGIGTLGVLIAVPVLFVLTHVAVLAGVTPQLPLELRVGTAAVTILATACAALVALRAIRRIEPVDLLR
jgi:putative ABC transport system permease protein